jgi:hypothetical protein
MPLKLTQTPKEELKPFLTNLGTAMRVTHARWNRRTVERYLAL